MQRRRRAAGDEVGGDCYDNASCESFFATLECELIDRQVFPHPSRGTDGRVRFYQAAVRNPYHLHSSLGCDTLFRYETRHAAQTEAEQEEKPIRPDG